MPFIIVAECIHDELKCIPFLSTSEISSFIMHQWKMAYQDYFSASKKLDKVDYVTVVLLGLKDLCVCNWVTTHYSELVFLSSDDFMVALHHKFLAEG